MPPGANSSNQSPVLKQAYQTSQVPRPVVDKGAIAMLKRKSAKNGIPKS